MSSPGAVSAVARLRRWRWPVLAALLVLSSPAAPYGSAPLSAGFSHAASYTLIAAVDQPAALAAGHKASKHVDSSPWLSAILGAGTLGLVRARLQPTDSQPVPLQQRLAAGPRTRAPPATSAALESRGSTF